MTSFSEPNASNSDSALASATGQHREDPSRTARYAGWAMTAFAALFLAFDASMKLLQVPMAVSTTTELGYPASVIFKLGVLQLICLILYLVPRTAVLGALLWTGYLGGAIATHVRVQNPLFSHVLFPIYVALLLWGGLWLRYPRLRSLIPLFEVNRRRIKA